MKKLLLLLPIYLICQSTYAQIVILEIPKSIEIGKMKNGTYTHFKISYNLEDQDTTYTFTYRDAQYSVLDDYKSVLFQSDGNSLESFYKICKSVFKEENKKNKNYSVHFKLGNDMMSVTNSRIFGITYMRIGIIGKGYSIPILEFQIDKLFGKI